MLEKIHNAPRKTRQRWFVVLTVIAGVVLVFLWVKYLSWSLRSTTQTASGTELQQGFGPAQSLKGIGSGVYDWVRGKHPNTPTVTSTN